MSNIMFNGRSPVYTVPVPSMKRGTTIYNFVGEPDESGKLQTAGSASLTIDPNATTITSSASVIPQVNVSFEGITELNSDCSSYFSSSFKGNSQILSFSMEKLRKINGDSIFSSMFSMNGYSDGGAGVEYFKFPALEEVSGTYNFYWSLFNNTHLISYDFSSLRKVYGHDNFEGTFTQLAQNLDIKLPALEEVISDYGLVHSVNSITSTSYISSKGTGYEVGDIVTITPTRTRIPVTLEYEIRTVDTNGGITSLYPTHSQHLDAYCYTSTAEPVVGGHGTGAKVKPYLSNLSSSSYNSKNFYQTFYLSKTYEPEGPKEFDFSKLRYIKGKADFYQAFEYRTELQGRICFPSLEKIEGGGAFYQAFYGCKNVNRIDFPKLQTIIHIPNSSSSYGGYGHFYYLVGGTGGAPLPLINFDALETIIEDWGSSSASATYVTFNTTVSSDTNQRKIYFPSLKTVEKWYNGSKSSFSSSVNPFTNIVGSSSLHTHEVHFPMKMQSTMGNWTITSYGSVFFDLVQDLTVDGVVYSRCELESVRDENNYKTAICWKSENGQKIYTPFNDATDAPRVEPAVGDTVYSNKTCTVSAGTISAIA